MNISNQQLYDLSQQYIPGGVNSPVRAFKSVGGTPIFFNGGKVLISGMLKVNVILIMSAPGDL